MNNTQPLTSKMFSTTNTTNIHTNSQLSDALLDTLKIASINVNSLISLSKRNDFYNFATDNNFDIIHVCKTKLNPRYKIQFSEYDLIRVDRVNSQNGGGTAILIKKTIPYRISYNPSSQRNSIVEYTIINTKINNQSLFIIALYANNKDNGIFTDELNHLFSTLNLDSDNNYYIIAGDFKARYTAWGDSIDKKKGTLLKKWLDNNEGIEYNTIDYI